MRRFWEIGLLVIILFMQIIFLIISFDVPKKLNIGNRISIIQTFLIMLGFLIAYNQIIFSRKIEEKIKIWEDIYSLENDYIKYRVLEARNFLNFLENENKNTKELADKYFINTVKDYAEFKVEAEKILDKVLYKNSSLEIAFENFFKKEDNRNKEFLDQFLIEISLRSDKLDMDEKTKTDGKKIVNIFKEKIAKLDYISEENEYKKFKEEIRKILN